MIPMVVVLALHSSVPTLFGDDAVVQAMIASALVVVALQQPLAGVVFVLDGVLLGAGDATYLAWSRCSRWPPSHRRRGGWRARRVRSPSSRVALSIFMLARAAAFGWRMRGDAWLVTGATR